MKQQPRPVPHLRKGIYYTIKNCANGLALSMPKTNKFNKDKPEFQSWDPNNINQIWMLEEIFPNRYEIVHAVSTLVLECLFGTSKCKLEFGKWKNSQLFYLEDDCYIPRSKNNSEVSVQKQGEEKMGEQKEVSMAKSSLTEGEKATRKSIAFKAGERFVAKIRIKENETSRKYLYCQKTVKTVRAPPQSDINQKSGSQGKVNTLKFMQIDICSQPESTLWQISQVKTEQNQILSKTCYISSFRSGMVLDVPEATDKPGAQIIQYPCNFRFNQKWILKKVDEVNGYGFFMISNAKTGLYLDIEGESTKEGTPIIQWQNHEGKNQIWRLQQQGKRTYLIRSALDKDLLIGVKENSLKEDTPIITSKMETNCFWIIHGHIPQ